MDMDIMFFKLGKKKKKNQYLTIWSKLMVTMFIDSIKLVKVLELWFIKLCSSVPQSTTKAKQFELHAVKVNISKDLIFTVIGCYRPLLATKDASLLFLMPYTVLMTSNSFSCMGDLKWDWLSSATDCIKELCNSLNHTQFINVPTRPNLKDLSKSRLLSHYHKNVPQVYINCIIL